MKTTFDLSDSLLEQARKVAARDGVTVKSLVEQGLRSVLSQRTGSRPFKLRKASVNGQGLSGEWRDASWRRIRNAAYGQESGGDSE